MPRANNQAQLLEYGEKAFQRLLTLVDQFSPEEQNQLEVFPGRTIKDLLAHLDDWLTLVFTWEDLGKQGIKPALPAAGYAWKDLPAFNEMLYQKARSRTLPELRTSLEAQHLQALQRIRAYQPEDLEAKARFAWTGSTSVASYYASCTSSHYVWAADLLKKLIKRQKSA